MIQENKIIIAYPNKIDKNSTVSGGNWSLNFPLINIKDRVLKRKARTINTLESSTKFTIQWNKVQSISAFSLVSHNLTVDASWKVKFYLDNTLLYESPLGNIWEPYYSTFDLEFEYDNWWSGLPDQEAIDEFTPITVWFGDLYVVNKIEIEIFDTENPDGYIEIGRVFVSSFWQPKINVSFGANFGTQVNTTVEEALSGTDYFDRRQPKRTMSFSLNRLTEEEAFGRVQDMQRELGIDRELLIAFDRQGDYRYHKTFLGRLKELNALDQPYTDYYSSSFEITEIL